MPGFRSFFRSFALFYLFILEIDDITDFLLLKFLREFSELHFRSCHSLPLFQVFVNYYHSIRSQIGVKFTKTKHRKSERVVLGELLVLLISHRCSVFLSPQVKQIIIDISSGRQQLFPQQSRQHCRWAPR